jgi:hypothetical protein
MLPFFPKTAEQRSRLNREFLDQMVKHKAPMLSGIVSHFIHEGAHTDIVRPDGTTDRTKIDKLSGFVELNRIKRSEFDIDILRAKLDEIAEQFAEGMSRNMIAAISESADRSGNVVDGGGKPLSPETVLEALDTIEMEFNSDGTYDPPSIIVSPEQARRLAEMASGPAAASQQKRLDEIMERKLGEYRLREAGRVLAG